MSYVFFRLILDNLYKVKCYDSTFRMGCQSAYLLVLSVLRYRADSPIIEICEAVRRNM
jgi:hypothetical protein